MAKYKLSLLNIPAFSFLLWCVLFTISRYAKLSAEEGWGVVAMVGLTAVGLSAVVVDFLLQWFISSRKVLFTIELIILATYAIALILGGVLMI
jgi:hypothetical protein